MNPEDALLERFRQAVQTADTHSLDAAFKEAERCGLPTPLITRGLTLGLESARMKLKDHTTAIPEFLLCVDTMNAGLQRAAAMAAGSAVDGEPRKIVIGVVEGDVHDLGKNIIAGVLRSCGHDVVDLGRDVEIASFVERAKNNEPALLALSCMMSTAVPNMRSIIGWSRRFMPAVPIIVGGAALDAGVAEAIGADGYAESAVTVPEEASRLLGC